MTFNSIDDIEKRLNQLSRFSLRQVAHNVGVARYYDLRQDELRVAILAIAKGEVAPLPYYKRHIRQDPLMFNQDFVDAVLIFSETNLNK